MRWPAGAVEVEMKGESQPPQFNFPASRSITCVASSCAPTRCGCTARATRPGLPSHCNVHAATRLLPSAPCLPALDSSIRSETICSHGTSPASTSIRHTCRARTHRMRAARRDHPPRGYGTNRVHIRMRGFLSPRYT